MTVKRTQNSAIPGQTQPSEANITDGTSNTIMSASSPEKTTKPFSKDVFETSRKSSPLEMQTKQQKPDTDAKTLTAEGNLYVGLHGDLSGQPGERQTKTPRDEGNVIESVSVKYTFMDYTDDDGN